MSYSNGLWGKVSLADHKVSSIVQFDDGPSIRLNFSFKGLMFLQLTLSRRYDIHNYQKLIDTTLKKSSVVRAYDEKR